MHRLCAFCAVNYGFHRAKISRYTASFEVDASGITARQGARSRVTRLLRGSFACLHHTRRALGEQECGELHRTFVAASSLIVVASCPQLSHAVPALPNSDLVCIGAAAHRVCLHDRSAVVLAQVSGSMCVAGRRIKDMLAAAHGMSSSTSSWPRPTPAYAEPILCVSTIGSTYMASLSALATIGRTTWPRLYFSRSMCDVARRSMCDMWGG